jgi:hypothetical protein
MKKDERDLRLEIEDLRRQIEIKEGILVLKQNLREAVMRYYHTHVK